jgi:glycosyltransferase involved in cell wall biosynthesis
MPVRNGATTIGGQLRALADQDFAGPWEVVVADNGSTDRTLDVVEAWRGRLPALRVVDASARANVNVARNAGASAARGAVFLFADADDEVHPTWITAMVAVLDDHDLACGVAEAFDDRGRDRGVIMAAGPDLALDLLPYAIGANLGVRREAFEQVGGFDDRWPVLGSDDIDFCWRAQLAGAELGFSDAVRIRYRQPATPGATFAKQRGYGRGTVVLGRRFAGDGARPWTGRYVARNVVALGRDLPWLLSDRRRLAWVKRAGWVVGVAEELVRRRDRLS